MSQQAIWRLASMAGLGLAAVFAVMALLSDRRVQGANVADAAAFIGLCGGFAVFIAALLYYLRWRQPLEVTPHGIDGFDASGANCFVRWEQMRDWVGFTGYLFIPCVLIRHTATGPGPLQIPLMLERREELRAIVVRYAGSQSPLVEALA